MGDRTRGRSLLVPAVLPVATRPASGTGLHHASTAVCELEGTNVALRARGRESAGVRSARRLLVGHAASAAGDAQAPAASATGLGLLGLGSGSLGPGATGRRRRPGALAALRRLCEPPCPPLSQLHAVPVCVRPRSRRKRSHHSYLLARESGTRQPLARHAAASVLGLEMHAMPTDTPRSVGIYICHASSGCCFRRISIDQCHRPLQFYQQLGND